MKPSVVEARRAVLAVTARGLPLGRGRDVEDEAGHGAQSLAQTDTVTADARVRTAPPPRGESPLQQGRGGAEHRRALGAERTGARRRAARRSSPRSSAASSTCASSRRRALRRRRSRTSRTSRRRSRCSASSTTTARARAGRAHSRRATSTTTCSRSSATRARPTSSSRSCCSTSRSRRRRTRPTGPGDGCASSTRCAGAGTSLNQGLVYGFDVDGIEIDRAAYDAYQHVPRHLAEGQALQAPGAHDAVAPRHQGRRPPARGRVRPRQGRVQGRRRAARAPRERRHHPGRRALPQAGLRRGGRRPALRRAAREPGQARRAHPPARGSARRRAPGLDRRDEARRGDRPVVEHQGAEARRARRPPRPPRPRVATDDGARRSSTASISRSPATSSSR